MTYTYKSDYECYEQLVEQVAAYAMEVGVVTALQETTVCDVAVYSVKATLDLTDVSRQDYERDCEAVYYRYVKFAKSSEQSRIESITRLLEVGNRKGELTEQDRALIYKYMIDKDSVSVDGEEWKTLRSIHRRVFPMD